MTTVLRIVLVIVSVLTTWMIMRKIRTSQMRIEDSIFWIGFSFMLIFFSVCPQIVYWMSDLSGTQTPVNFIFTFIIFVLIVRMFRMTVKISQLETRLRDLVERIAIEENLKQSWKDPAQAVQDGEKDDKSHQKTRGTGLGCFQQVPPLSRWQSGGIFVIHSIQPRKGRAAEQRQREDKAAALYHSPVQPTTSQKDVLCKKGCF